jgi:hypothetical protein
MKVTLQPASHNVPIEMGKFDFNSGTMWACRSARGSNGRGSLALCVEVMVDPLGLRIVIGWRASFLICTGKLTVKKLSVLPVSAIAMQEY